MDEIGRRLLIIQTAFVGDVVLATPLMQAAKHRLGMERVGVIVRSYTASLLDHHPAVDEIIVYDKNGNDRGIRGLFRMARLLKSSRFDIALIPHRSLRSALLARMAGIPVRVGFESSAGRWLFTQTAPYRKVHEVERNLDLLKPWNVETGELAPSLYPDETDHAVVDHFLEQHGAVSGQTLYGFAPGSLWPTKRWLPERFAEALRSIEETGNARVVLFGGSDDTPLCQTIAEASVKNAILAAGRLTLLQSAALAARCVAVVSNDSGMGHIAAAMGTPVVSLFGPTVTDFGFAPYGSMHRVVERPLSCRPCSRHGGARCPISTHACMREITTETVMRALRESVES
jgi:heptosyltransferase-2